MQIETLQKLKKFLSTDEGNKNYPYYDSNGFLTIGIGRNLTKRGLSNDEVLILFNNDVQYFMKEIPGHWYFFNSLDENRQIAIINIAFNVGINGLMNFSKMLKYLEELEWEKASEELLNSEAARNLQKRYGRLAKIILTGELLC